MRYGIKRFCILVLISILSLALIFTICGCTKSNRYGTAYFSGCEFIFEWSESNLDETIGKDIFFIDPSKSYTKTNNKVDIYNISAIKGKTKIHYAKKASRLDKDGIIASKWVYLASVYGKTYTIADYNKIVSLKEDDIINIWDNEVYSLQKISIFLDCYKPFNGGPTYKELFLQQVYAETFEKKFALEMQVSNYLNSYYGENITPEIIAAALVMFNIIDFECEKVGRLSLQVGNEIKDFNVIGYIETEADKLLSSSVPLDITDSKYQTVRQQVMNPKIYSVANNILE